MLIVWYYHAGDSLTIHSYSLVGCMCQPAFEFKQFELFKQSELFVQYPHLKSVIEKYALK